MIQNHLNFQHHSIFWKFPLKNSLISLYRCESESYTDSSKNRYPKMVYAHNGGGTITIDDQPYPIDRNILYLFNHEHNEFSITPSGDMVDFMIVGLTDFSFVFPQGQNSDFARFKIKNKESQFFLSRIIKEIQKEQIHYMHSCIHYLNLLMINLQRDFGLQYRLFTKEKSDKDCEIIREYINHHFRENITLDLLAKVSNMNKYYLVHTFTSKFGCSPINYLNDKKIEESKRLLETTDYSIAEIARKTGFSSQSYFSQSFKKHTYMTPNEYRRINRKQ